MKKILSVLTIAVLLLGAILLTACNGEHTHVFVPTVIEPTCVDKGYTDHVCAECGYIKRDSFVDPVETNHKFELVSDTESTCTEQGAKIEACVYCGLENIEYHDLLEHKYGSWKIAVAPTCTESGTEQRTCSKCAGVEERVVDARHDYVSVVTAPTCLEQGYTTHTCNGCGDVEIDTLTEKVDHQYGEWIVVEEADCDGGLDKHICVWCEEEETRETAPVHTYDVVSTTPTCEEQGYNTYICACGDTYVDDYSDARGHDYTAIVEVIAPTCTEMGYTSHKCVCGAEERTDYTSPVHTFGEWVVTLEPSCPNKGLEERTCELCGEKEERFIDVREHNYTVEVIAPTYDEAGYTIKTCPCGSTIISNVVEYVTEGLEYKLSSNKVGYKVIGFGNCTDSTIVIPKTIEGVPGFGVLPVTEIRYFAFDNNEKITCIYIPETVEIIGEAAFEGCVNLEKIVFRGTMAQWNAITKRTNWNHNTGNYIVVCSDGVITK